MSNIKKCFVSRFGDEGRLVEVDYSQIEVVVQAFLSGDTQMREDIVNGVDFHCKRLAYKLKEDYDEVVSKCATDSKYKKMRKDIKVFSFRKAYGAGAPSIAEVLGVSVEEAKEFFAIEDALYPKIKELQDGWVDEVRDTKKPSNKRTQRGLPACVGHIKSITGKRYVFYEDDAPSWMRRKGEYTSFKPTKIKNYPVQGLAGELLYAALGKLVRILLKDDFLRDKCLMINTIHDSILFDVHVSALAEAIDLIKSTMLAVPERIKELFGFDFDLPLKVDVEFGLNWADLEEVAG
jgi:DNA polymerase I-like protein with 3'-5' exonuclease and polymerase domains